VNSDRTKLSGFLTLRALLQFFWFLHTQPIFCKINGTAYMYDV
jgi:hypothetical protein